MIDPNNVTHYNRTTEELQEFFLFCCFVAGKKAKIQAQKLEQFINLVNTSYKGEFENSSLFYKMHYLGKSFVRQCLEEVKVGNYDRLTHIIFSINKYHLKHITLDELESIKGIGPKTARFFLLHSRKNQNLAVLDVHLLAHLRDLGYKAPKSTPIKKYYGKYEEIILKLAEEKNMTPADYDLMIWKSRSNK